MGITLARSSHHSSPLELGQVTDDGDRRHARLLGQLLQEGEAGEIWTLVGAERGVDDLRLRAEVAVLWDVQVKFKEPIVEGQLERVRRETHAITPDPLLRLRGRARAAPR